jgi:hypothetical protein
MASDAKNQDMILITMVVTTTLLSFLWIFCVIAYFFREQLVVWARFDCFQVFFYAIELTWHDEWQLYLYFVAIVLWWVRVFGRFRGGL